ncbi:MAG: pseudouridine synthase [Gammaproteobacteria bacterium]
MSQLILFNKPFNVLSQFTDDQGRETLKDFITIPGVYPAGRLDRDSEGLLLLTDDGALAHRIAHPDKKMSKTYWAQIEGTATDKDLQPLREGILLKDGPCKPAKCRLIEPPYLLWERTPAIRYRQQIPDCWLEITLSEGRNRQVRRMCAAIGYPVLRLIRYRIGSWTVDGIAPGKFRLLQV